MSDLEGVMLGDYLLLKCISKGGVADVYRARQVEEGNYEVAVKIFRSTYAQRESFREYFMAEAEKIGQFSHPNILPFLEFGEGEGLLYTVTPFVESGTLDDLLKRVGGKFSAMQALPIMQQLCSAVQYAHDNDVIHGNIKPSNIFVAADGRMLLSDFGIAHGFDDSQHSLTRIGWSSAEYAAPEQSLGVLRRTSDIYTLGILLFRILTGQTPFTGQTPVEVLLKHVRQQAPSARVFEPSISDQVDDILHIAMQKRSDNRFGSAKELSDALLTAVTVAPIASPVSKPISSLGPQHSVNQPSSMSDPFTPLPTAVFHTPPPLEPPTRSEQAVAFSPYESTSQRVPNFLGEVPLTEITEVRPKIALEDENAGAHPFWSVSPVEWSPLEKSSTSSQALHASDYLSSKPEVLSPTHLANAASAATTSQSGETKGVETPHIVSVQPVTSDKVSVKSKKKPESLFQKILPIIVVILLLLGLIGALLAFFLMQSGSSNTSSNAIIFPPGLVSNSTQTVMHTSTTTSATISCSLTNLVKSELEIPGAVPQQFLSQTVLSTEPQVHTVKVLD